MLEPAKETLSCPLTPPGRRTRGFKPTLVAVQAAPALPAVALPGQLTGPVFAAGVSDALVAALALPALLAHALPGRLAETMLLAAPCTDG